MKMSKEHIVDGIFLNKDIAGLLSVAEERLEVLIKKESISNVYHVEHTPFARGKFAAVRKCTHRETGVEYAAKFIRKRRRAMDQRADILHEMAVLAAAAGSSRIVALHEVYETATEMALVLELASGGELQHILDVQEGLDELQAARVMKQILEGLSFLHHHNIAHLDLKPQNLLLTGNYPDCDIKLCDFGISRVIQSGVEVREILGTPDYVAPEVLSYEPISLATDIWSVGVLAYVLVSGFSPFGGDSKQETFCNISQCKLEFPEDLFQGVSNEAKEFIRVTLNTDPRKRPSVEECLTHPWLSIVNSETNIPASLPQVVEEVPQKENDNENENELHSKEVNTVNGDVKTKIASWDKKEPHENIGRGDFNSVKIIRDITNCWTEKTNGISSPESIKLASKGNTNIVIIPLKKNEEEIAVSSGKEDNDILFSNKNKGDVTGQFIHSTNTIADSPICLPLSKNEDDKDSPVNKKPKNCMVDCRSSFPIASCLSCAQCGSQCCHHPASHPSDLHISQHHHKSITKSPVKITIDRSIIC